MSVTSFHDLPAPAKLNLFLHVVGRRDDGYHLLQSVFTLIDWMDTLHVELRRDGGISRHDIGAELPADDLCLRAARALQQASGCDLGAHITIEKRVPWGAGLGGGSSDAATTLLALNRLWGLNWPRQALLDLGLRLGADVPFFLGGRDAWVEGVGERLTPIELPPARYLVVKPPVAIPTAKIFSSPLLRRDTSAATVAVFLADTKRFGKNDLQPCAESYSPQVAEALAFVESHVGPGRMSGSGSAVFAVSDSLLRQNVDPEKEADRCRQVLATLPAGWSGRWCEGLAVHPLHDWAHD